MTAAAFVAFAHARVEWAVVEVGIGGRLDSTNVLSSDVAVITNVGLEHTDVLGETIEAIAAEKAGIIEANGTLVTPIRPSSEAGRVIVATARRCEAMVRQVEVPEHATLSAINLATAREVFEALGALGVRSRAGAPPLGAATLSAAAIANATMPGRMERFRVPSSQGARLPVVMDGAHVDFALTGVLSELRLDPAHRLPPIVLMALGSDKNATAMLGALVGIAERVVCVQLPHGRPSWGADQMMDTATAIGLPAETAQSPEAGLQRCLDIGSASWILVTGSLHLVGALRRALTNLATAEDSCGNQ